ncbi:MAG: beta-propeller domain-containing protein, partial [Mogibacterium sp.]|nr:beta-propeller domain-containing protein [Mogibacterium sp.]
MEKKNDHIKELFNNDGIKAPDSLSEENILKMLEAADTGANVSGEKEFKKADIKKKRPAMFRLISAAAAMLVVAAGIGGWSAFMHKAPDTSLIDGELFSFENEQQIRRLVNSLDAIPRYDDSLVYESSEDAVLSEDTGAAPAAELTEKATGSSSDSAQTKSSAAPSHSSTYLQVDDVDEADIVKTDGKYIYCVTNKGEVVILSASGGKTERLSTVGSNDIENYVKDIYIKGDTLITVGQFYKEDSDTALTGIVVYDISDRSHPEYVSDFSQSGSIVSTRLTGDHVYIVTNKYVYKGDEVLPVCGPSDNFRSVPLSDICCVPEPQEPSYLILSSVDISSGSQGKAATKAVFGTGNDIYCNDHNLYVASYEFDSEADTAYTRIVRASLDGTKVKFDATTKVRGSVYGQFAMDEKDGYFRIATTSQRAGMDVNNLYVLDKDLKEAGKVSGFARNESIKSVRFIGS